MSTHERLPYHISFLAFVWVLHSRRGKKNCCCALRKHLWVGNENIDFGEVLHKNETACAKAMESLEIEILKGSGVTEINR